MWSSWQCTVLLLCLSSVICEQHEPVCEGSPFSLFLMVFLFICICEISYDEMDGLITLCLLTVLPLTLIGVLLTCCLCHMMSSGEQRSSERLQTAAFKVVNRYAAERMILCPEKRLRMIENARRDPEWCKAYKKRVQQLRANVAAQKTTESDGFSDDDGLKNKEKITEQFINGTGTELTSK